VEVVAFQRRNATVPKEHWLNFEAGLKTQEQRPGAAAPINELTPVPSLWRLWRLEIALSSAISGFVAAMSGYVDTDLRH
jgi:hypothetical protein